MRLRQLALLLLLTLGALLIHGYHPFSEDGALYVPGVKYRLNPSLYRFHPEFFLSHARLTLFDELLAGSVRLTHLPLPVVLLLWHLLAIFLMLLASWRIAAHCFRDPRARWGGVGLVAALLTMPVAGTALYLMDPYLNPRSLSTAGVLLAIAAALRGRWGWAALWMVLTALVHPFMAVFGIAFMLILGLMKSLVGVPGFALALLPFGISFGRASEAYRDTLTLRSYFFLRYWSWYEWLGIFGPLLILWAIARFARGHDLRMLEVLSRSLIVFELAFFAAAIVLEPFPNLVKLQPMRALQLVYILMLLFLGGLLGQWVLNSRLWRWFALFVPLCAGMWLVQRQLFSNDAHIEWPGAASRNGWVQAFQWIRQNTPPDAIFALNADYRMVPGEDWQGFRAIAERSLLADNAVDGGAASMFPALAPEWHQQSRALAGWARFQAQDFQRLRQRYGVTWTVVQQPVNGLDCPYHNAAVMVCRIP